jgi:benzoyl-CoA reductase/2-hydroxyglutaryl-CoA dehydratase subunit BcrC/BadD/HgdB
MDKQEHSCLLEKVLANGAQSSQNRGSDIRLMVIGAETDDTEVVSLIESLGVEVVVDLHSSGTRYFWNDIVLNGHPIDAIAARYLEKIPLPQMDFPNYTSTSTSLQLAKDFSVKGTIILLNTHCDPFQWDIPVITKEFQKENIAVMTLELDPIEPSALTRNRLEAFIEMLKAE